MNRTPLDILEKMVGIIGNCSDLESGCKDIFLYIRQYLPARGLTLGFIDPTRGQMFALAYVNAAMPRARKICRYIQFSKEKMKLAVQEHFFENPNDIHVESLSDPVADILLQDEIPLCTPFLIMRCLHKAFQQGSAVIELESDVALPENYSEIISALRLPINIFITEQYRYWEFQQTNNFIYEENERLKQKVAGFSKTRIIGGQGALKPMVDRLRQVAPLNVTLLITGETGTGKEIFAHAAHELSTRKGPFIAVNCGAIPEHLIDNELFGHAKGAYTGASENYKGRFENASGGTLFLDEIGELPLNVQTRLLRVLESRAVERLGSPTAIPVDFRLIAATHRNLKQMVADGEFRQDLYYRLAVVPLRIPPLRERKQDIPLLVRHFVKKISDRFQIQEPILPTGELARLARYDWPGNVRELQNVVEEAVAICQDGILNFGCFDGQAETAEIPLNSVPAAANSFFSLQKNADAVAGEVSSTTDAAVSDTDAVPIPHSHKPTFALPATVLQPESYVYRKNVRALLMSALAAANGKIHGAGSASELLEMNANTLRAKLRKYEIPFGRKISNKQ